MCYRVYTKTIQPTIKLNITSPNIYEQTQIDKQDEGAWADL